MGQTRAGFEQSPGQIGGFVKDTRHALDLALSGRRIASEPRDPTED